MHRPIHHDVAFHVSRTSEGSVKIRFSGDLGDVLLIGCLLDLQGEATVVVEAVRFPLDDFDGAVDAFEPISGGTHTRFGWLLRVINRGTSERQQ